MTLEHRLGPISDVHCIHCRVSCSADASNGNSDPTTTAATSRPALLRCSRCKIAQYCSKSCQKNNFKLHKSFCKRIHQLQAECATDNSSEQGHPDLRMPPQQVERSQKSLLISRQHELAHVILQMAHRSTDTVERGYIMYRAALMAYYKVLLVDPLCQGGWECTIMLLALLNHHQLCWEMIHALRRIIVASSSDDDQTSSPTFLLRQCVSQRTARSKQHHHSDPWIFGAANENDENPPKVPATTTDFPIASSASSTNYTLDYQKIVSDFSKHGWNPNAVLVPVFWMEMRKLTEQKRTNDELSANDLQTSMIQLATCIERAVENRLQHVVCDGGQGRGSDDDDDDDEEASSLPFLMGLSPDSCECVVWSSTMTASLLTLQDATLLSIQQEENSSDQSQQMWERDCFILWHILKDSFAFTPGMLDTWDTIAELAKKSSTP